MQGTINTEIKVALQPLEQKLDTLNTKLDEISAMVGTMPISDLLKELKEHQEWAATLELAIDKEIDEKIERGRQQARNKEGRSWREVQKDVRSQTNAPS